jgi:hypothetical protein
MHVVSSGTTISLRLAFSVEMDTSWAVSLASSSSKWELSRENFEVKFRVFLGNMVAAIWWTWRRCNAAYRGSDSFEFRSSRFVSLNWNQHIKLINQNWFISWSKKSANTYSNDCESFLFFQTGCEFSRAQKDWEIVELIDEILKRYLKVLL